MSSLAVPLLSAFVAVVLIATGCSEQPTRLDVTDFDAFVLEVADALALQDLERLISQVGRTRLTCEGQLLEEAGICKGVPAGTVVEGVDLKRFGESEIETLGGGEIRLLLDGLFGADLSAPTDEIGGPGLQVYSTRFPDELVWFPADEESLPLRGNIGITYIGPSPSEDEDLKRRRLWGALAEETNGVWKIRLWLVGFPAEGHPALNPSEENGFQRWFP